MSLYFYVKQFQSEAENSFAELAVEVCVVHEPPPAPPASNDPISVRCPAITMQQMTTKMTDLGRPVFDQIVVAAVCSDLLGVTVHPNRADKPVPA